MSENIFNGLQNLSNNKRIKQLDSLRFFAIFVIMLSHLEFLRESLIGEFYWTFLHNATFGVDFFFMLSGFGLYYSSYKKEVKIGIKDSFVFAIRKIKKIYLLYIFSLILCLPFTLGMPNAKLNSVIIKFLLDMTLLQSLFGATLISHGINAVCWFLSVLFVCYLFALPMIVFIRKKCANLLVTLFFIFLDIILITFLSILFLYFEKDFAMRIARPNPLFDDLFYGSPYIRIWYVFLGMLISVIYLHLKDMNINLNVAELCIGGGVLVYFFLRNIVPINMVLLRLIDVLSTASFLLVFSLGKGKCSQRLAKSEVFLTAGGKYGMYLYLLHYPVRMNVDFVLKKYTLFVGKYTFVIEVILIFVLTVFLCIFCKNIFEKSN